MVKWVVTFFKLLWLAADFSHLVLPSCTSQFPLSTPKATSIFLKSYVSRPSMRCVCKLRVRIGPRYLEGRVEGRSSLTFRERIHCNTNSFSQEATLAATAFILIKTHQAFQARNRGDWARKEWPWDRVRELGTRHWYKMADGECWKMMNFTRFVGVLPSTFHRLSECGSIRSTQRVALARLRYFRCQIRRNSTFKHCPQSIEDRLKRLSRNDDIGASIQLFEDAKSEGVVPHARSFASLLHLCHRHGRHEELDFWFHEMQRHYGYIGEGVRSTLINSYTARREWSRALEVLRSLQAENTLRHTRSYIPLICGLAQAGQVALAFELFQEKLAYHRESSKKDKQLISDSGMLAALIKSCYQRRNVAERKVDNAGSLNNKGCGNDSGENHAKLKACPSEPECETDRCSRGSEHNQAHSSFVRDCNSHSDMKSIGTNTTVGYDGALRDGSISFNRALEVFDFYHKTGSKVTADVLGAMKGWFMHDPLNSWMWHKCNITRDGTCSNCNGILSFGIPQDKALQLSKELLCCLEDECQLKRLDKFSVFQKFVETTGPFDIVVDGMNVGYTADNIPSSKKKFQARHLKDTVVHFTKAGKKILLLVNIKLLQKEEPAMEALRCDRVFIRHSHGHNDFDILYAAAYSGMGQVCVVTNDSLRDHRLLLSGNAKWTYLQWTRENLITVKSAQSGKLQFKRNHFDPTLHRTDAGFHIPVMDGTWRCVQKQAKYCTTWASKAPMHSRAEFSVHVRILFSVHNSLDNV